MFIKTDTGYFFENKNYENAKELLKKLQSVEDYSFSSYLDPKDAELLMEKLSPFFNRPNFSATKFGPVTLSLLSYLAHNTDEELFEEVRIALGCKTAEDLNAEREQDKTESVQYRNFWMKFSQILLTSSGFEDFHFGKMARSSDGCYLYDEESVFAYVIISKSGIDKRKCELILTLLGNPEAVTDGKEAMMVEWCFLFDTLLSKTGSAELLSGSLTAIDPYGKDSRLMRRYRLSFSQPLSETELADIMVKLKRKFEVYPS